MQRSLPNAVLCCVLPALAFAAPLRSALPSHSLLPVQTAERLTAPMKCGNESIMPGMFYGMQGYKIVEAASASECCGICASELEKCQAWTFGHADAKCHLKSEAPTPGSAKQCEAPCAAGPPDGSLPPAAPPGPAPVPTQPSGKPTGPNILLLFPDQWRYDWDGFTRDNQPDIPGPMLHVPTTRKVAAAGTRFTTAYVPAPVCAPSRSCLASGREYGSATANGQPGNWSNVLSNGFDYPIGQTTFYDVLRARGYHVMTTGKDDLTKASQLGSKLGYPGCPQCKPGDGQWHLKELGFSDALRYSGKMDVVQKPEPHEMYGFYLQNHTVHLANGSDITGWQAHRACMGKASRADCINSTFTPELYEDDFTAVNAIQLLQRAPEDKPWFLHVSFPGPHDPFLVTTEMRNAASDGRVWPSAQDNPGNNTPGGACAPVVDPTGTRTRCNYAAEIENLDRLFQLVLDEVESKGQSDNTVVCIASDHGEMLGDHGDVDKSKPWEGSAHVPLMCSGPGILKGQTVTTPVATMDMAGTFMDYADAIPEPHMTTKSFRSILEGKPGAVGEYRPFVSSGLSNFRMVVQQINDKQYKYICCQGSCPNPPSTAPVPKDPEGYVEMLIDIVADPYDMHDLAPSNRDVVERMRPLLPTTYAQGCAAGV